MFMDRTADTQEHVTSKWFEHNLVPNLPMLQIQPVILFNLSIFVLYLWHCKIKLKKNMLVSKECEILWKLITAFKQTAFQNLEACIDVKKLKRTVYHEAWRKNVNVWSVWTYFAKWFMRKISILVHQTSAMDIAKELYIKQNLYLVVYFLAVLLLIIKPVIKIEMKMITWMKATNNYHLCHWSLVYFICYPL